MKILRFQAESLKGIPKVENFDESEFDYVSMLLENHGLETIEVDLHAGSQHFDKFREALRKRW